MEVWSLVWEDPLEKEMTTYSGILAWRIPWTEEPGGPQSTGLQSVGQCGTWLMDWACMQSHIKDWSSNITANDAMLACDLFTPVHFQGKPYNITVIQVYAPTTNAKEAEVEPFYEDLQDLLELTPKKRCPLHHRGLECKRKKSRDTWTNRQVWPWSTKWSRAKAKRILPRKCTGHSKYPLPKTQEKTLHMDITRWSIPKSDWLYSLQPKMEKVYTITENKTRNWLWLRSWTPYCQIQIKLNKAGKNH